MKKQKLFSMPLQLVIVLLDWIGVRQTGRNCESFRWGLQRNLSAKHLHLLWQSVFEFNLRLQEYIELIRKNETKNALEYARKHFGAFADTCMQDINLAMGLLIFPWQNDKNHRYSVCRRSVPLSLLRVLTAIQVLMSEDRWDFLQDQFREEIATVYSLPDMPLLVSHIQAGLSVLKTP